MQTPTEKPKRHRRLPRWSMRAMFIGITIVCVVMGLVSQRAERQRRAVAALQAFDDGVSLSHFTYDFDLVYSGPDAGLPGPAWLRELIGLDYFADVVGVVLTNAPIRDDDLRQFQHFTNLEWIVLIDCNHIADSGLDRLKSIKTLTDIHLRGTKVTQEGVADLRRALPNCDITSDF